jgi:hypothetical protein
MAMCPTPVLFGHLAFGSQQIGSRMASTKMKRSDRKVKGSA